jgi:hypothetical protein
MEENKFFQWVWRVNAVMLFLVCLMFLIMGIVVLHDEIIPSLVDDDIGKGKKEEPTQMGTFTRIHGTRYFIAHAYSTTSCSKSGQGLGNYLFMDSDDLSCSWLFPVEEKQIVSKMNICGDYKEEGRCDAEGLLFEVRKIRQNGDKRLKASDTISVFVSDQSGQKVKEVVTGIDRVLATDLLDPETVVLTFEKADKRFVAKLSLVAREILDTRALPEIR